MSLKRIWKPEDKLKILKEVEEGQIGRSMQKISD